MRVRVPPRVLGLVGGALRRRLTVGRRRLTAAPYGWSAAPYGGALRLVGGAYRRRLTVGRRRLPAALALARPQLVRCYGVRATDGERPLALLEVSALRYSGGIGLHARSPLLRLQSD